MEHRYDIKNLDCANCAAKLERHLRTIPEFGPVSVNFATLTLTTSSRDTERLRKEIQKIEPEVEITDPAAAHDDDEHDHGHDHSGGGGIARRDVAEIAVALVVLVVLLVKAQALEQIGNGFVPYLLGIPAYLLVGFPVLRSAFGAVRRGFRFDENVLMTVATIGAFFIGAVSEAVGVMLFYKVGETIQNLVAARSRKSIKSLLATKPNFANLLTDKGLVKTNPESVAVGATILVKPGEKIPLDGVVIKGESQLDTSALTGESRPVGAGDGDTVLAGSLNLSSTLTLRTTRLFEDSSIAKILVLVEKAAANKAPTEKFITRFARYYTPAVVALAAAIAVLPPLFGSAQPFSEWLYRALVLLVISCPCALLVSIPLGYFGGIGGASHRGILVKGANILDALAQVDIVAFDKTGTLTRGQFRVLSRNAAAGQSAELLLQAAATAETHSNHPIARSICQEAVQQGLEIAAEAGVGHEVKGQGVVYVSDKVRIAVGNDKLMRAELEHFDASAAASSPHTVVHVAVDRRYVGYLEIGDEIKTEALELVPALTQAGVKETWMLTGDNAQAAQVVASRLGVSQVHAGMLPEDKVTALENALARSRGKVAFVGDGINDAPVLARADVGIAMGAMGSDAAVEIADVVIMNDNPMKVVDAMEIARKTRNIVWQNIVLALAVKVVFLSFGAFGLTDMWEAVFADVGTTVLAVFNASRIMRA